jgi:hypothetical protein
MEFLNKIMFIVEISVRTQIACRFIALEGLAKKLYGRKPLKEILSQYNHREYSLIYPMV